MTYAKGWLTYVQMRHIILFETMCEINHCYTRLLFRKTDNVVQTNRANTSANFKTKNLTLRQPDIKHL